MSPSQNRISVICVQFQIVYIDSTYTTLPSRALEYTAEEFIRTMEGIYESWTDVFHSAHEEPGYGKF